MIKWHQRFLKKSFDEVSIVILWNIGFSYLAFTPQDTYCLLPQNLSHQQRLHKHDGVD